MFIIAEISESKGSRASQWETIIESAIVIE
jgi:hypothetical protein